jgi:hypothetical protein
MPAASKEGVPAKKAPVAKTPVKKAAPKKPVAPVKKPAAKVKKVTPPKRTLPKRVKLPEIWLHPGGPRLAHPVLPPGADRLPGLHRQP